MEQMYHQFKDMSKARPCLKDQLETRFRDQNKNILPAYANIDKVPLVIKMFCETKKQYWIEACEIDRSEIFLEGYDNSAFENIECAQIELRFDKISVSRYDQNRAVLNPTFNASSVYVV